MRMLKVPIPDDLSRRLEQFCRRQHQSAEDAVREILRKRLLLDRFHELCRESEALASAAGFRSEDDLLEAIS